MNKDEIRIRVEIAEKLYNLTIPRRDEEKVRRAAKRIKEETESLKKHFDASLMDYLAMAAFNISLENENNIEKLTASPEGRRLEELTLQIEEYIGKREPDGSAGELSGEKEAER